jgi:hypothetical protein
MTRLNSFKEEFLDGVLSDRYLPCFFRNVAYVRSSFCRLSICKLHSFTWLLFLCERDHGVRADIFSLASSRWFCDLFMFLWSMLCFRFHSLPCLVDRYLL